MEAWSGFGGGFDVDVGLKSDANGLGKWVGGGRKVDFFELAVGLEGPANGSLKNLLTVMPL